MNVYFLNFILFRISTFFRVTFNFHDSVHRFHDEKMTDPKVDLTTNSDGYNAKNIRCLRCSSLILQDGVALLIRDENSIRVPLPSIRKEDDGRLEDVTSFWAIDDIYLFENLGFSKTTSSDGVTFPSASENQVNSSSNDAISSSSTPAAATACSTSNELKYLMCADCDLGPIGCQDLQTKKSYVATNRVKYDE